jgi:membrane protease YdiL (CAAX protease family)
MYHDTEGSATRFPQGVFFSFTLPGQSLRLRPAVMENLPGGAGQIQTATRPANRLYKPIQMRPYRTLLLLIMMVFLGGALLAPWLYWLVQYLLPASALAHKPFHRYVDRALLGLGLMAIWPLVRAVQAKSWRDVGLCRPSGQWGLLTTGLALGFSSLAFVAAIAVVAGARRFNPGLHAGQFALGILGAIGAAALVATLEEILFRGAIFGALRRGGSWEAALVVSSVFYAFVHFLGRHDTAGPITWHTGLESLPGMLTNFGHISAIPSFLNLTLAGMILGLAYQRTGNLYLSIGLHAGWIFWLKLFDLVTVPAGSGHAWLWGTEKMTDAWVTLPILLASLLLLPWLTVPREEGAAG